MEERAVGRDEEQTTQPTPGVTSVHSEEVPWTKTVKPDWRTWCGNLLPRGLPAISDGFSIFLKEKSDDKRYTKLEEQRSVYEAGEDQEVVLDSSYAEPLRLVGVYNIQAIESQRTNGRVALKHVAILSRQRGSNVLVNAERLRCAMLVSKAKHCWIGTDGRVYLCDRADTGIDLFGDAPVPRAAIAPLNQKRSWEIEALL